MNRLNGACGFFGIAFGFLFASAGLNQYDTIHAMLLLENFEPFLIMATAMATAMPILWVIEKRKITTLLGGPLKLTRNAIGRHQVIGGIVFGAGWAITGACPGTASTTLGAGSLPGVALIAGMIAGIALRDCLPRYSVRIRAASSPDPDSVAA